VSFRWDHDELDWFGGLKTSPLLIILDFMAKKPKNKIYTNKFGPKGSAPIYVGKKRLSTGRIKYIYKKQGSGSSGAAFSSAIPSAIKGKVR
jgi:hypothetical protein